MERSVVMAIARDLDFAGGATGSLLELSGSLSACCNNLTADARMAVVAAAVVVAMCELVANTGVGGSETMSAGRQRREEVEEAGYMMGSDLAGVYWKHMKNYRRPVGGTRMMSQLRSRERLPSVARD